MTAPLSAYPSKMSRRVVSLCSGLVPSSFAPIAIPRQRRHSVQIELNRALYMDEVTPKKLPGFAELQRNLTRLVEPLRGLVQEA